MATVGPRHRRRPLLFFDERGFSSVDRFRSDFDASAAVWDQWRGT